ncbi:MAG: hypothetical protein PVJ04_07135 [Gemmatimonadota bacterium]|jgi:hypothetical protein
MNPWWLARLGLAILAVLMATVTSAVVVTLGATGVYVCGAGAYVSIAALALLSPAAIAAQVLSGQVLVGALLLRHEGPGILIAALLVGTVIVTAEILAAVARVDSPLGKHPRGALPRAGFAALVGGGVFVAVALAGGLPGPTGLLATLVTSGACVAMAGVLHLLRWDGNS